MIIIGTMVTIRNELRVISIPISTSISNYNERNYIEANEIYNPYPDNIYGILIFNHV